MAFDPIADALATASALSPLPLLLCDAEANVLAVGQPARRFVDREPMFSLAGDRFQLDNARRQQALMDLLARAAAGEAPGPRDSELVLLLERDGKPPLSLLVSGVPDFDEEILAVYLHEPCFTARISEPTLCRLYGFTRAEARVARMLVNGMNAREIAGSNKTSLHTVRNQIKSVLAKTGANRQAELVILLLTGPAHTR